MRKSYTKTAMGLISHLDFAKNAFVVVWSGALLTSSTTDLWMVLRTLHKDYTSAEVGLFDMQRVVRSYKDNRDRTDVSSAKLIHFHRLIQSLLIRPISGLRTQTIVESVRNIVPTVPKKNAIGRIKAFPVSNPGRAILNRKIMVDSSLLPPDLIHGTYSGSKVDALVAEIAGMLTDNRGHMAVVVSDDDIARKLAEILPGRLANAGLQPIPIILANDKKLSQFNQSLRRYADLDAPTKLLILHSAKATPLIPIPSTHIVFFEVTLNISRIHQFIAIAASRRTTGPTLGPNVPLVAIHFVQNSSSFADSDRRAEITALSRIETWLAKRAQGNDPLVGLR